MGFKRAPSLLLSSLVAWWLVVLASGVAQGACVKVMTYNIHHGEGMDGQVDLERIARIIKESAADIVALQEVDCQVERSGGVDQPRRLGELLNMHVAYGPNIELGSGKYGNAVLSRFPIVVSKNHLLPRIGGGEQRGVLHCKVRHPSGLSISLFATHFDHRKEDAQRIASARQINQLSKHGTGAGVMTLLAGDLNDTPSSGALKELLPTWKLPHQCELPTIPVQEPARQIDYVLIYSTDSSAVVSMDATVVEATVASDHLPLLARFEFSGSDDSCGLKSD